MSYERLVADAMATEFEGWDWSAFDGRFVESRPSWNYRAIVRKQLPAASSLLDLGTGGGELLASLPGRPARTVATEGYAPNVEVARRTLAPLGVEVVDTADLGEEQFPLPFPDASFDLVINRHESYAPDEVFRVLRPGGRFVTQQVGGRDVEQLNAWLGAPPPPYAKWDLATAVSAATRAGLEILDAREEHVPATFHDIGAVVLFMRVTPWQLPGLEPGDCEEQLREWHATISAGNPLAVTCHRFLMSARRPGPTG